MLRDIRLAVRTWLQRPGFAMVAIATLAIGIGANTAIFSIVNAVLLRPLPYPSASRVVRLRGSVVGSRQPGNLSPMDFLDLEERGRRFERMAAFNNYANATLTGVGEPERLVGARVSAAFLSVLQTAPQLGRDFRPDDDVPGATPVAILSDGLWRRRFGADPDIVGKTIDLNSVRSEVIGVLPASFRHPLPDNGEQPDVYVPFKLNRQENNRGGHFVQALGLVKGGVSPSEGEAELATIAEDLARQYLASNLGRSVTVTPLYESMVGATRPALLILLGTVVFVLLIACANLANLLLARSTSRNKEIAVRQALGATRSQLMRQLMTESIVLAVVGGGVGLLLARWAVNLFIALGVGNIPRADDVGLDASVLVFTMLISGLTGVLFGVGPALYATRLLGNALKAGGRSSDGRMHQRAQHALVASEVALALMLLVGAGLLIKSFWRLEGVDPGFRPVRVLTLQTSLPLARYPEPDEIPFYRRLEDRIRPLPGVEQVAAVNILPLGGNYSCEAFDLEDRPAGQGRLPCSEWRSITPDYFRAMGIRLVKGRSFTLDDTSSSFPVVIVSDRMAEVFWPGRDPVGARIQALGSIRQVVGVVGAVRHFGLDRDLKPEMYTPQAQQPSNHTMTLVIRASNDPLNLIRLIRRELSMLDPDVPISNVKSMEQVVGESAAEPRFRTWLLGAFALLALVLAVVGVAAVISYSVSRRTHEIGVRLALGATGQNVVSWLMIQGMMPTALGVVLGAGGALALTRVMSGLLFGVTATDSTVFVGAALALSFAAVCATYIPARRATTIDPMIALRAD